MGKHWKTGFQIDDHYRKILEKRRLPEFACWALAPYALGAFGKGLDVEFWVGDAIVGIGLYFAKTAGSTSVISGCSELYFGEPLFKAAAC